MGQWGGGPVWCRVKQQLHADHEAQRTFVCSGLRLPWSAQKRGEGRGGQKRERWSAIGYNRGFRCPKPCECCNNNTFVRRNTRVGSLGLGQTHTAGSQRRSYKPPPQVWLVFVIFAFPASIRSGVTRFLCGFFPYRTYDLYIMARLSRCIFGKGVN